MPLHGVLAGRRALVLTATAGASLAAALGLPGHAFAAYTANVSNQTLQIAGDGASDQLALRLAPGDPSTLQLDVGADGTVDFAFNRSTFDAIDVQAGGGDDTVRIDQSDGALTGDAITLEGGNGNDTLIGGDGDDTLIGGNGNDTLTGARGSDTLIGGNGSDTFVWNPGDASDTIDGQGGNDTLDFNGSNAAEKMALTAQPDGSVQLTRDVAAITMDLDAVETVDIATLGSADTVTVGDLSGTDVRTTSVDLGSPAGSGGDDGAADVVTADGTDDADNVNVSTDASGANVVNGLASVTRVFGGQPNDALRVATLGGDDTVTAGVGVTGSESVQVDGGEGDDTLDYRGSNVADTIGIANNGTFVRTFANGASGVDSSVEQLDIDGLGGDDSITGQNGIATTHLTVDGGSGNDTIRGGDGDDTLIGGSGNDVVTGGRGADVAELGGGSDTFVWDPGDGSDTVEGEGGTDTLAFNGSNAGENISLSANGSRLRLFRDVGNVTMDTGGVETVAVETLGSADHVTIGDLSGTDVRTAAIDLAATPGGGGDGAADTVTEVGTDGPDKVQVAASGAQVITTGLPVKTIVTGSEPANDTLTVATLGGSDKVTVGPGVAALINPVVDLGSDQ